MSSSSLALASFHRLSLLSSFSLLPQLPQRHRLVPVLAHDLGHRHLKVLLGDVDAALPQREHAWKSFERVLKVLKFF